MRISDWSSDVCSSDLAGNRGRTRRQSDRTLPPGQGEAAREGQDVRPVDRRRRKLRFIGQLGRSRLSVRKLLRWGTSNFLNSETRSWACDLAPMFWSWPRPNMQAQIGRAHV